MAALAAFSKNDNPIKETVGTMVRGVRYLTSTPTIPGTINNNLIWLKIQVNTLIQKNETFS
jgi:hypothetical protein